MKFSLGIRVATFLGKAAELYFSVFPFDVANTTSLFHGNYAHACCLLTLLFGFKLLNFCVLLNQW